jgi:hypothetical protein
MARWDWEVEILRNACFRCGAARVSETTRHLLARVRDSRQRGKRENKCKDLTGFQNL